METISKNEEKYFQKSEKAQEEWAKLRLEAAELKHRLLLNKTRQQMLKNTEKKKRMKESTPPPLKERKEIRKEVCLNNYNNNKGDSQKTTTGNPQQQVFVAPTVEQVQAYMDEIGEHRFTALKFWNYYEAKDWVLGKSKMRFWKRVLDNWVSKEDDKSSKRRGKMPSASQPNNTVTFNAYKPIDNTGAISYDEYLRMKNPTPFPSRGREENLK